MYRQIGYGIALLFLGILSVYDIKWKKIPIFWPVIFGVVGIVYFTIGNPIRTDTMLPCMLPGMFLLLLALITGERIGYGDGVIALVLGFFLGGFLCMMVVSLGILMTGVYSLCRIACRCKKPVPLIPFFLAAMEVIFVYA